ncbi:MULTISPECIES: SDR family oxidoreductase [Streptomyces]|uniref:Short chain dehydrogenase n=1 Tax=Streptomyces venezuelae TaxID=54571 RepID=A0A5P2BJF4_STRVZ|nr:MULTISPECIES: SDR family oxidoreductase [Streptomyces]NDZ97899.1 SDR family oxidoreductase [Streptomyces sp. SID10116]MYY80286.1 SDR family oxidoreductase [Streptomyces sp. SID335]MYZ16678.1 SDR family oxidoreductase [Streptomyces sp. SID337]NDZ89188.1 SDR family oxidoreductase [Streptomyces sp. SID10115]NEB48123.1 SDR family oxidoreductase [Streptomyces sp. SID339]
MTDTRQVVVVTGGTRGVGAGIARSFLAAGAHVVICARRPPDEPVEEAGATAEFRRLDLRDAAATGVFFAEVAAEHGRVDCLVNNAGGTPFGLLAESSSAHLAKIVELNLFAPLHASLSAYELMRHQPGGGSITMIGSVSGTRPSPGSAAYGAAKAGLENLAGTMAVEWAPAVRVNTVVLGLARTESAALHYGDEEGVAEVARTVPLGRLADPSDVGDACVFLASDRARYISGAALRLHGGGERPAFLAAASVNH